MTLYILSLDMNWTDFDKPWEDIVLGIFSSKSNAELAQQEYRSLTGASVNAFDIRGPFDLDALESR